MMAAAEEKSSGISLEDESFIVMGRDVIEVFGIECVVCKEVFDTVTKQPKLLPCNHTTCACCLDKMVGARRKQLAVNSQNPVSIECPQCKKHIDSSSIKTLPNDHRVIKGLDVIKKAKSTFKNVCFKHDCKKLIRYCATCEIPMCSDCEKVLHTNDPDDSSDDCTTSDDEHAIVDLNKALNNMAVQFDDVERKCTNIIRQKKINQDILRNIKHRLNMNDAEQISKVEERFDFYSKKLNERKETLIRMIKDNTMKLISDVNLEVQRLEGSTEELQKVYDCFTSSRENEDVRQIFKIRKQLNDDKANLLKVHSNESLCKTFEFKECNGDRLEDDLTTTGSLLEKIDLKLQCPPADGADGQISKGVFQFSAP